MNHPSAPPRSTDGQGLALVVVGVGVCSALHVGKLPVAIPHLQAELALNLVQAGFLLSLVQLAGLSLGLLVGLLADRLGPRRVMLVGLCVLAAGSAGGALAPDVNRLLVFRVVEGAGFLLTVLPAPGLLRLHLRDPVRLSRALGWWGTYMPMGTALALLLGLPLMAWSGWRTTWWLLALCSLAAAAWLALRVPATVAGDAGPATSSSLWPRLKRTLRAPGPWLVALGFLLYSGQWLAVVGFLPTIYVQAGLGAANVAVLSALAAAVNMVGNVAAGRWLARGARPGVLVALGYGAMAAGAVVAFGAVGYPVLQYLAVLLFSAVGGLIPGTLFGVAVVLAPGRDTVSTTVGWMQQFSALGQFIGPPAVAWWVTRVGGWHWTWVLTGACSLLGLLLAVRLQREWTARPGTPAN
ncbi:CynX/NimT family MFS transporter [Hydrogenophaga pseudoflava]|uniref:Hexuronate transporter n=1 Tax=Hydrogenophaga pseudoflava TaxID=47421 RepID=A0A4P6X0A3_HYDPS|nr:MFS transporter [Hydrogenophaga pseudoflava]QBM29942.1 Hexuronate transporter [Hydrogenophaga pseudoflava]